MVVVIVVVKCTWDEEKEEECALLRGLGRVAPHYARKRGDTELPPWLVFMTLFLA